MVGILPHYTANHTTSTRHHTKSLGSLRRHYVGPKILLGEGSKHQDFRRSASALRLRQATAACKIVEEDTSIFPSNFLNLHICVNICANICVRILNLFASECKTKHVRLVPACQSANLRRGKSLTCATCSRSSSANEGHFLSVCLLLKYKWINIEMIPRIQISKQVCHLGT